MSPARRKSDDDAISDFLTELAAEPWLGERRRWWPSFLFHFTDVRNVPSIVAAGRLLCRSRAVESGRLEIDAANSEIIAQTPNEIHRYVRLYFRPRTPTFHRNEGIRPLADRSGGAHCPVPVALLFDARHVLGMVGTRFSDGNLATQSRRRANTGEDVDFLRRMPFRQIYHEGRFAPEDRDEIVFRRHAEVIVPGELPLDGLRYVVVRSAAERETVESLLQLDKQVPEVARRWIVDRLRLNRKPAVFHYEWTYVERVTALGEFLRVEFNASTATPGPFTAVFTWEDQASGATWVRTVNDFLARKPLQLAIPVPLRQVPFWFTVRLDDSLAYVGRFTPTQDHELLDVPF